MLDNNCMPTKDFWHVIIFFWHLGDVYKHLGRKMRFLKFWV